MLIFISFCHSLTQWLTPSWYIFECFLQLRFYKPPVFVLPPCIRVFGIEFCTNEFQLIILMCVSLFSCLFAIVLTTKKARCRRINNAEFCKSKNINRWFWARKKYQVFISYVIIQRHGGGDWLLRPSAPPPTPRPSAHLLYTFDITRCVNINVKCCVLFILIYAFKAYEGRYVTYFGRSWGYVVWSEQNEKLWLYFLKVHLCYNWCRYSIFNPNFAMSGWGQCNNPFTSVTEGF